MLKKFKKIGADYPLVIIGIPIVIWFSLFFVPKDWLGKDYFISNSFLLRLFPVYGVCLLVLSFMCKKITYFVFGLLFLFSFFVTMFLGYLFLGP